MAASSRKRDRRRLSAAQNRKPRADSLDPRLGIGRPPGRARSRKGPPRALPPDSLSLPRNSRGRHSLGSKQASEVAPPDNGRCSRTQFPPDLLCHFDLDDLRKFVPRELPLRPAAPARLLRSRPRHHDCTRLFRVSNSLQPKQPCKGPPPLRNPLTFQPFLGAQRPREQPRNARSIAVTVRQTDAVLALGEDMQLR